MCRKVRRHQHRSKHGSVRNYKAHFKVSNVNKIAICLRNRINSTWMLPGCWTFYPSMWCCEYFYPFWVVGRTFVLCSFGQYQCICTICHRWQYTGVVHLSLQADGGVAFEDIPAFGICRPACHDSSLYIFVPFFPWGCNVAPSTRNFEQILQKCWRSEQCRFAANNHSWDQVEILTDNQSIFDRVCHVGDWDIYRIPEYADDEIRTTK